MVAFQVRKCQSAGCGLRYPCKDDYTFKERCPRCGSPTEIVLLQHSQAENQHGEVSTHSREQLKLEALLDNVRSAWNVGSIFRSADGAGFTHLYLCGITPTPEYPATLKTSLGAEKSLPWSQHLDGCQLARSLTQSGYRLWALENDPRASTLYALQGIAKEPGEHDTIALVVGNEVAGVDPELLDLCERVLYLPMQGMKRSYNVAVSFGIAAHYLSWLAETTST